MRIHEIGVVVPSVGYFASSSFFLPRFRWLLLLDYLFRHYNRPLFATVSTSFFFRDHFSPSFSSSFRRGPHLLSIFERWLCIEFRSHETDASRISRGMLVRSHFPLYLLSLSFSFCPSSLAFLFIIAFSLRRIFSSLPLNRFMYKGRFTQEECS